MKFYPIEATLKNGASILIRLATKKDAANLLHTVSGYMTDSSHLLTDIDEFTVTVQDERRWIHTLNTNRNSLLLIATCNKKIIGNIDLRGELRRKTYHNATLGIGMSKGWRGLGLGTLLMQCAVNWARQNHYIETVWLHVFANHTIGLALYRKIGFEEIGRQKDFIRNADGSYTDNVIMRLHVK